MRSSWLDIKHIHSCVQQPCKFTGTKESVNVRKDSRFKSHRIGLEHQYGCHGVMCICCSLILTLVQFVFEPVQYYLNWFNIFEPVQYYLTWFNIFEPVQYYLNWYNLF